jgi:hypothetical protein
MKNRYDMSGDEGVPRNADLAFRATWAYQGAAVDLTGHALDLKVYGSRTSHGAPLITCDNADAGGITVPDPLLGQAYYLVPQASLASLPAGLYYYYARDTSPGGIMLLLHGVFETFGPAS